MNRLQSDSRRRSIDNRISKIVISHKSQRQGKVTSVLSRTFGIQTPHDITTKDASFMYTEKCNDLEIAPNPIAEQKFLEQFINSLQIKSLKFGRLGLGPGAIRALLQIIWDQKKYVFMDLSMNRLTDSGAILLAEYIQSNPPIIYLDLRSNNIMVDGAIALFQALEQNDRIVSIDMSVIDGIDRNRIGTSGCQVLAELLKSNEIISHLNISMSGISIEGCGFLTSALAKNKSLMFLDLSGNRFGTQGANNLFKDDYSFGCIETLVLAKNGIGDAASQAICRQIELSKNIQVLDFTDNNLSKNFMKRLQNAVRNTQLRSLLLSHNKIGVESSEILFQIIHDVPSLEILDLSYNPLKDTSIESICDALKWNSTLLSIDLTDTLISDKSAVKFAKVISKNKALQKLILDNNRISDVSTILMAKALAKNHSLIHLSLKSNEMNDDSAQVFIESLQFNNTILDIDIDYNDFSYRTLVQLTNAIASHKKTITQNIAELAQRKIDSLKEHEIRLTEVREETQKQTDEISQFVADKERKENLLKELTAQREIDIIKYDKMLEEIKQEYEKISEERRSQLTEFNKVKLETESAQASAMNKYQGIAAKRQHAAARLKRANDKKMEAQIEANKVLDDLKLHLLTMKEQLRNVIDDARAQQKMLSQKEEEEKLAKQAQQIAENMFNRAKKSARKGNMMNEKKKVIRRTPITGSSNTIRPKTANGAPIVTPSLGGGD
ncbi:hypothetical protein TRFO_38103 [Tritrichomonas foetus]|uniref:Leucine Rich Repeat family protein n=1 Tax=Tritrichomonas foetus TaxID=1144522 RepID=A0A1J4J9B8_9EUKA|nr:hypothetical protein TRFO_38103 [Tritrichomonas foetus]|eukprot:OHS95774.1 hypothetical protein TRFO_38103 [Tritrichomonas foetus]